MTGLEMRRVSEWSGSEGVIVAELYRQLRQGESCLVVAHMVVDTLATGVDLAPEVPRPRTTGKEGRDTPGRLAPIRGFSGQANNLGACSLSKR